MLRRPTLRRPRGPGATFADPGLQRELELQGFVVVPLLDRDQLEGARALTSQFAIAPGDPQRGLFNDSWSTDRGHTARLSAGLGAIVGSSMDHLVPAHRALIWGTSVKWPGEAGAVGAHRDPTFVDEARHRSVGVWCALERLDGDRGTLVVHPGSHRASDRVRVHQSSFNLHPDLDLHRTGVPVPLEAGQAIVYDHSLLHGSRAIAGDGARVVVMSHLVPLDAELRYAVPLGGGRAAQLRVEPDFFVRHQMDQLDVDRLLGQHEPVAVFDDAADPLPS